MRTMFAVEIGDAGDSRVNGVLQQLLPRTDGGIVDLTLRPGKSRRRATRSCARPPVKRQSVGRNGPASRLARKSLGDGRPRLPHSRGGDERTTILCDAMASDLLTVVLALWGAVLSTVLAVFKIVEHRSDRAVIKVSLQPGMKAFPSTSAYGTMTLLLIKVTNVGRRPTSITHASLMLRRGEGSLLCSDPISARYPVELTENTAHSFAMNEDEIKSQYRLQPQLYVAFVNDAAGRTYWSHGPLARLWKLKRLR